MKIGKIGMERKYIIGAILFLISFGILVYWLGDILVPQIYEQNERATCRTSFDVNAKRLEVAGVEVVGGLIDVSCRNIDKTIGGDTREEVFGQLADLMAMAWEDVRRGKRKVFEDDTAVFCMPRYSPITFEEKDKVYPNFYAYLANEKPIGREETYAGFLMNRPLTREEVKRLSSQPDLINSNVDYAIIFVMAKETAMYHYLNILKGYAIGLAAATVTAFAAGLGVISGGLATPLASWLMMGSGIVAGHAYNLITSGSYEEILENNLSMAYGIGSDKGDGYATRLWLIPYDTISKLNCDKLKLNRYG